MVGSEAAKAGLVVAALAVVVGAVVGPPADDWVEAADACVEALASVAGAVALGWVMGAVADGGCSTA